MKEFFSPLLMTTPLMKPKENFHEIGPYRMSTWFDKPKVETISTQSIVPLQTIYSLMNLLQTETSF